MPPPIVPDKSDLFAQYQIVEELGEYPNYTLYKVKSPDGPFKLWKKVDTQFNSAAAAIETRLLPVLEKIHHPYLNAVSNSFIFPDKGLLFIESDYPAKTLRHRLEECKGQGGPPGIPVSELFGYIAQVAEGLDFLNTPQHQHQNRKIAIYHRAISPDSLHLFEEKGKIVCKLGDFGLAKPVMETGQAVRHSLGLTNYDYAPPEFDEGVVASTSDQYSLATTYYVLRTSKFPFTGSLLAKLQSQLNGKPDLNAVDAAERPAIARALSKDPTARFRTCREFIQHLQSALGGMAAGGPVNVQKILGKNPSDSGRRGGVLSGSNTGGAVNSAKAVSRSGSPAMPEPAGPSTSSAKTPIANAGWNLTGKAAVTVNAKGSDNPNKKAEIAAVPPAASLGSSTAAIPSQKKFEPKIDSANFPPGKPSEGRNIIKPVTLETENWAPGTVSSARTTRVEVPTEPPTPPPPTPAPKGETLSSKARETLELIKQRQAQSATQSVTDKSTSLPAPAASATQLVESAQAIAPGKNRPQSPPPRIEYPAPGLPTAIKRSVQKTKSSKNSKKSATQSGLPDLHTQPQPAGAEPARVSSTTLIMVAVASFCVTLLFIVLFSKLGH